MKDRKIIPCIYLFNENAVKSLEDHSLVDADPVHLAKYYEENNASIAIEYYGG